MLSLRPELRSGGAKEKSKRRTQQGTKTTKLKIKGDVIDGMEYFRIWGSVIITLINFFFLWFWARGKRERWEYEVASVNRG